MWHHGPHGPNTQDVTSPYLLSLLTPQPCQGQKLVLERPGGQGGEASRREREGWQPPRFLDFRSAPGSTQHSGAPSTLNQWWLLISTWNWDSVLSLAVSMRVFLPCQDQRGRGPQETSWPHRADLRDRQACGSSFRMITQDVCDLLKWMHEQSTGRAQKGNFKQPSINFWAPQCPHSKAGRKEEFRIWRFLRI